MWRCRISACSSHKRFGEWKLLEFRSTCALGNAVTERSLHRHRDAALSGKLLRMITAMQAFGWCHQYSIADLLIARDMGCEVFTSGLDASRFAPVIRFAQSFHLGIHAHIQPHYGMAMYLSQKIDRCRRCSKLGRPFGFVCSAP